ncbi:MAG: RHS repeat-associated core domain-containing protein [Betaproteobacteria bacterium]
MRIPHRFHVFLIAALLLGAVSLPHAATTVIIDNTDAGFSVIGTWPASTTVTGYQGTNYQTHVANGSPPGTIVVDNTDAGFSVTGTWPISTSVGGYLGANYQVHSANGEEPSAIVVDNLAGSFTGTWATSTSVGGYFGANYQHHPAGAGANSFTWTPTIPATGSYKVYARWTQHPNRSTQATYTVNHAGGATAVTVNQEANGGTWQLLGTFTLNAGSGHSVVLVDQGDGYVIADAIKVTPDGAAPNTATWTPTIPSSGSYKVYARWTAHPNRATDAKYTVTHAGGDTLVTVDQEQNNGAWVLLGTFSMAPGSGHRVSLTDQANGYVIADAIQLLDAAAPAFNTATWTPNAAAGQYEVYAKWTANPNRATNATYTVNHAQGTTPVQVNQQANGGAFNLLGTFNLNTSSTITLSDQANGYVIADAIQLIALMTVPKMYFVHTDHLNTPRLITSDTGQAVWQWNNDDPYGNNAPNENPAGAGQFTCNLRLPGQYFDSETNTHYNYFRDYDPETGRYKQSDPIGLRGGINTYAYVGSNPLSFIDPKGLAGGNPFGGGTSGGFRPVPGPFDVFIPGTSSNDAFVRSVNQIGRAIKDVFAHLLTPSTRSALRTAPQLQT